MQKLYYYLYLFTEKMETHTNVDLQAKIQKLLTYSAFQLNETNSPTAKLIHNELLDISKEISHPGNSIHEEKTNQIEIGLVTFKSNAQIDDINETARKMLSISRNITSPLIFTQYICPEDIFRFIEFVTALFESKQLNKTVVSEFSLRSETDSIYKVEIHCKLVQQTDGELVCLCSFIDISDYKFTQKTLNESERKYRITYERANIGIAHIALDGYFISVNPRLCEILGYSRDEILNLSFNQLISQKDFEEFQLQEEKLIQRQTDCVTLEIRFVHKNHNPIWINVSLICVYDEINAPLFLISFFEDITQKKIAEKTINKWNNIFKYADWGVAVINIQDFTLEMINPAFAKIHGYTQEQIKGKKLFELATEDCQKTYRQIFFGKNIKLAHSFENYHIARNGANIPLYIDLASICDKEGNLEYTVLCIQDISHQKELQKKLEDAEKKTETSEKMKNSLLSNISHEIRTPLNGILGFSELLKRSDLPIDKKEQFISIIQKNGHQLLNIMTGLLDLSRIEAGALESKTVVYQLNLLLIEIYSFYHANRIIEDKKQLKFFLNSGLSDQDSYIYADVEKLQQILANLIDNAIKYTSEGYIEFGYSKKEENLCFYVKDTGKGIENEDKNLIFTMFNPEQENNFKEFSGRGLGLTITKAFVELLGGEIWVESTLGEGSVFYFTIPYNKAIVEEDVQSEPEIELLYNYDFRNKNVLIVEDDEISYFLYAELLTDCGALVQHATSGTEAIEICSKPNNLDLIILDIQLPGADGITVAKEVRKTNLSIPIIAQTARAFEDFKAICLEAGCTEYHTKPMDTEKMLKIMAQYLS